MKKLIIIFLNVLMFTSLISCTKQFTGSRLLPTIHINNVDGLHVHRNEWRDTYIGVTNAGEYNKQPTPAQMRGRGNSTWSLAYDHGLKYPMRFRFPADSPQGILGLAAARDFVLLANAQDTTNARNYFAYKVARSIASDNAFNPNVIMVEVYFNGEFQGLYQLTEQMQAHENRVNIEVNDTLKTEWFLEMDVRARDNEDDDWFWAYMGPNILRSIEVRNPSNPTYEQINHVRNIIETFSELIYMDIVNINLEEYINVNSFINFFIVQELFLDYDIDHTSSFMIVDRYGIIHMGPTWDFDHSMVNYFTATWGGSTREEVHYRFRNNIHSMQHVWMRQLLKNESFVEAFIARWEYLQEVIDDILSEESMDSFIEKIEKSALLSSVRIQHNPNIFWCLRTNSRQEKTFRDNVENLFYGYRFRQYFISNRFPKLLEEIST